MFWRILKLTLWTLISASFLTGFAESQADDAKPEDGIAKNQLRRRNLSGKVDKQRFELRDVDWPGEVGEASVCLWKDDCVAAASMGIDDNCAYNLPWWMEMCKKYGLRPTWWIITGGVDGPRKNSGTWQDWKDMVARGYDVQSHTVSHLDVSSPAWKGMDDEYASSKAAIERSIPGHKCLILAYPGGKGQEMNDPALAAKYYIAARGVYPFVNRANAINYLQVDAGSGFAIDDNKMAGVNLADVFVKSPTNKAWRGWWVGFFHWIRVDDKAFTDAAERKFAYIQGKVKSGELWLGLFCEVAKYGQERDTAKLSSKSDYGATQKISIRLSDEMDDELFDFPLTVKVRIPSDWKEVKAMQGGEPAEFKLVEHEGGNFALLQIVPDRGETILRPAKAEAAN